MSRPFTSACLLKSAGEPHASLLFSSDLGVGTTASSVEEQHRKHKRPLKNLKLLRSFSICVCVCVSPSLPFQCQSVKKQELFSHSDGAFNGWKTWSACDHCLFSLVWVFFFLRPCFLYAAFLKGRQKHRHSAARTQSARLLGYSRQACRIAGGVRWNWAEIFLVRLFLKRHHTSEDQKTAASRKVVSVERPDKTSCTCYCFATGAGSLVRFNKMSHVINIRLNSNKPNVAAHASRCKCRLRNEKNGNICQAAVNSLEILHASADLTGI